MFIRTKKYDELLARNIELARQVRDLNRENKCLYKEYEKLESLYKRQNIFLNEIENIVTSNKYNREDIQLKKVKELFASTTQDK